MPTVAVSEVPHYYVEQPSFIGGNLVRKGAKIKTRARPSINWRPLNQAAYDARQAVLEERFDYTITLQDGTTKEMSHQPRLMSKTLGGGRGSLGPSTDPNAGIEGIEEPEPHLGEGTTLAEVATRGGRRSQDQRPGPAIAQGPDAFVPEPTPPGDPEVLETGEPGVVITQLAPVGSGYGREGLAKTTSKGSPIAPAKNGVVE